jgi:hypothetical protein
MNERINDTVTYEFSRRFLNEVTRKFVPKAEIKTKKEATDFRFHVARFVAVKVLRIKEFDVMFQAIGDTIYVPDDFYSKENPLEALRTVAHETVHLYDRKNMGILFSLSYLFPQIVAPLFLLLSLILWNAWFLIPFVLFLLPLPAYWRARLELRAYLVDLIWSQYVWEMRLMADNESWAKEKFQRHMSSGTYYFAFPFKRRTGRWFQRKTLKHRWKQASPYKEIISFLQEEFES